jgi:hypothetical protein
MDRLAARRTTNLTMTAEPLGAIWLFVERARAARAIFLGD